MSQKGCLSTYIVCVREDGREGRVFQVPDPPSQVKAVLSEMFTTQVLVSAGGPLLSLHVVYPYLQPDLILQREPVWGDNTNMLLRQLHLLTCPNSICQPHPNDQDYIQSIASVTLLVFQPRLKTKKHNNNKCSTSHSSIVKHKGKQRRLCVFLWQLNYLFWGHCWIHNATLASNQYEHAR